jgi:hypothetical protein
MAEKQFKIPMETVELTWFELVMIGGLLEGRPYPADAQLEETAQKFSKARDELEEKLMLQGDK